MKQFIAPTYTFTPGGSGVGTVNLSGISGFNIKHLIAVINQTRGVVVYSTGDVASRYTNLTGTTLTLNVDTSTHNSGDVLQIIYEVTAADPLTDNQLRATAVPVINSDSFQQTYSVAGVIPINTILLTVDLVRHSGLSVQIASLGTTGFITPEWSADNTTWVTAVLFTPAGQTNSSINLTGIWNAQKQARYFRLRLSTATTAGTTTIYTEAYQTTPQLFYATTAVSLSAGSAFFGDVGHQYRGSSTGAASGAHIVSAASTNATIVKAGGGRVIGWALANTNAAWRYVKLHNQTTTPTAGTGVVRTIAIPPNGLAQGAFDGGIAFVTGIGLTTVTGSADADTTAVGVGDIVGELLFA